MNAKKKHDLLVLNKNWVPIAIVEWKKAMSYLYKNEVHALDRDFIAYAYNDWVDFSIKNAEDYAKVHTVRYAIAIPEIIVLTKFDRLPDREIKFHRENVFHRDKFRCQYCGITFPTSQLTIDHIIPKGVGGKSNWNNVCAACKPCNNFKAMRTPEQAGMKLIHKPVKPNWLSPMTNMRGRAYICKSWTKFMDKIDVEVENMNKV